MKVTRILISDKQPALQKLCKATGFLRADLWRRYGALGTVGRSSTEIRAEIVKQGLYDSLPLDGTIRAETTEDIINSILASKEAAKKGCANRLQTEPMTWSSESDCTAC